MRNMLAICYNLGDFHTAKEIFDAMLLVSTCPIIIQEVASTTMVLAAPSA
jgi:hypothetical protein